MRNRYFMALALAAATLTSSAFAQTSTWAIDPAHSSINFEVRHMGVSNVHGSLGDVTGTLLFNDADITKSSVEATASTTTVSTGVEKRDTHLKSADFFDVTKYPKLSFKSTSLTNAGGQLKLIGDLTLNGVTKSVTLDVDGPAPPQKNQQGVTISGFSATGKLKRADFGFGSKFPSAVVGDDIKFSIDVEIDKK